MRVLGVAFRQHQRHLDILILVVPFHVELQRMRVKRRAGGCPADSLRQPLVESRLKKLIVVAVIGDDVLHRYARHLQALDNLEENLRRGYDVRLADRVQLYANHVPGLEELSPGFLRRWSSGEFHHAFLHHVLDRVALVLAVHDRSGPVHRYHPSRIRTGNPGRRLSFAGHGVNRGTRAGGKGSKNKVASGFCGHADSLIRIGASVRSKARPDAAFLPDRVNFGHVGGDAHVPDALHNGALEPVAIRDPLQIRTNSAGYAERTGRNVTGRHIHDCDS